jgi:phage gp29-like protein
MTQLLDQFGRPIAPLNRPETREIAAVSIRDRWSGYPSRGLTPGRLASIFLAADAGNLRDQAELFEEMEEKDPHLMSVMGTRRLAVLGLEHQVEDASDSPEDKKIGEAVRGWLADLKLKALFTHLLGAVGHGYAAAEIKWATDKRQWIISGFNLIHPKNISFANSLTPLVITEDKSAGVNPQPFQLIYHRHLAKSGHDTRNGVLRVVGWMYLFKNYALKDWAAFNEIFGMPMRLGKYEPSATPSDREALRQAITNLGTDAAGIISKSTEIEFIEAASRLSGTTNPYQVLASFCNREMSKAVLGQTLTTDTEGSTGTYSAGKVQAEVRDDLLEADAESLAETIRDQVIRPLVGFNFGWDKPIPGFSLPLHDSPDLKMDSEVCKNLNDMGVPIPLGHIYEHFGIPEPQGDEPTTASIKTPATPQPPDPAAAPGPGGRPAGEPPAAAGEKGKGGKGEKGNGRAAAMKAVLPLRNTGETPVPPDTRPNELELIPQDGQVIRTQQELEALSQAALAASADAHARMLAPVKALIDSGATLEALRDGLLDVYPELPVDDFGELLYQARMLAYMRGRVENA